MNLTQLSALYVEAGDRDRAVEAYRRALYVVRVMGGDAHPLMVNLLLRLGGLYEEAGELDHMATCVHYARQVCSDLLQCAGIDAIMAQLLFRNKRVFEAVHLQKGAFRVYKQVLSEGDERLEEVKKGLETYLRAAQEMKMRGELGYGYGVVEEGEVGKGEEEGGDGEKKSGGGKKKKRGGKK